MSDIEKLEQEIERLKIKLDTLINYLQVSNLGPPHGRGDYDRMVKVALAKASLQE
jgi:hypothetical protein